MNLQKIKNIKSLDVRIWIIILFWIIFFILKKLGIFEYNSNFCSENFSWFCESLRWRMIGIIITPVLLFSYFLSLAYKKAEKTNKDNIKEAPNYLRLVAFGFCTWLIYLATGLFNIKFSSGNNDGFGGFMDDMMGAMIGLVAVIIFSVVALTAIIMIFQKKPKK